MSVIKYEVSIRSAFYKFGLYTRNIKILISRFESIQHDKVSNKLKKSDIKNLVAGTINNFYSCKCTGTHNNYSVIRKYLIIVVECVLQHFIGPLIKNIHLT